MKPPQAAVTAKPEIGAIYSYTDASGELAFEVVYYVFPLIGGGYLTDTRGKRRTIVRQRRPSGEPGSWVWGLDAGEFMRTDPGKNWFPFDAAKFEQYPATRERKFFDTAAPIIPYQLRELRKAIADTARSSSAKMRMRLTSFAARGFVRPAVPTAQRTGERSMRGSCRAPIMSC